MAIVSSTLNAWASRIDKNNYRPHPRWEFSAGMHYPKCTPVFFAIFLPVINWSGCFVCWGEREPPPHHIFLANKISNQNSPAAFPLLDIWFAYQLTESAGRERIEMERILGESIHIGASSRTVKWASFISQREHDFGSRHLRDGKSWRQRRKAHCFGIPFAQLRGHLQSSVYLAWIQSYHIGH